MGDSHQASRRRQVPTGHKFICHLVDDFQIETAETAPTFVSCLKLIGENTRHVSDALPEPDAPDGANEQALRTSVFLL